MKGGKLWCLHWSMDKFQFKYPENCSRSWSNICVWIINYALGKWRGTRHCHYRWWTTIMSRKDQYVLLIELIGPILAKWARSTRCGILNHPLLPSYWLSMFFCLLFQNVMIYRATSCSNFLSRFISVNGFQTIPIY